MKTDPQRSYGAEIIVAVTERDVPGHLLGHTEVDYRTLINHAPVMVWQAGTDAHCTYFNKPWLDFTGRTLEQEIDNGWSDSVHAEDCRSCLDAFLSSFRARRPFTMEYRLRRHDGEYRWMLSTGVPFYDSDEIFCGYIGSCIDITDHRRAEQVQAEALSAERSTPAEPGEERFRTTFQQAAVGLAHVSLEGRWIQVNERLCEIVGYSQNELLGKTLQEITHPDDLDAGLAQMQELLAGKIDTYCIEKRYVRPDGSPVWIELRASLVRETSGEPKHFIAAVQDIKERKQAVRTRDEVISLVSHDLRNPLGAIAMSVSFLLDVPLPEDQRNVHLHIIQRAAGRMNRLIQDLLDAGATPSSSSQSQHGA